MWIPLEATTLRRVAVSPGVVEPRQTGAGLRPAESVAKAGWGVRQAEAPLRAAVLAYRAQCDRTGRPCDAS